MDSQASGTNNDIPEDDFTQELDLMIEIMDKQIKLQELKAKKRKVTLPPNVRAMMSTEAISALQERVKQSRACVDSIMAFLPKLELLQLETDLKEARAKKDSNVLMSLSDKESFFDASTGKLDIDKLEKAVDICQSLPNGVQELEVDVLKTLAEAEKTSLEPNCSKQ